MPGIFISYRRGETAYPAGWLFDRLVQHFGAVQIFKDVDSIQLGDDFVEVITRAVGSCDVLLALVGDRWLTITDAQGQRRLDDPNDFVRLEIEAALTRNVRVIPILVDGASMPRADELPASLAQLERRQALELSPSRFDYDTSRLLKVLDATLAAEPWGEIPGYSVAAKTGTAQLWDAKAHCLCQYGSSYIGMAPASNPQVVVAVNIQRPRSGNYFGNAVAGPVFYHVMKFALQTLKIPPDRAKRPNVRLTAP